jgi:hypothetical protein
MKKKSLYIHPTAIIYSAQKIGSGTKIWVNVQIRENVSIGKKCIISKDVYIDKNPKDTIHIKYTTIQDVKNTIDKLEKLYKNKKYSHKRIWQVGMIMKVRLEVLKNKKPEQYSISKKYFEFLGRRTKLNNSERYNITFKSVAFEAKATPVYYCFLPISRSNAKSQRAVYYHRRNRL